MDGTNGRDRNSYPDHATISGYHTIENILKVKARLRAFAPVTMMSQSTVSLIHGRAAWQKEESYDYPGMNTGKLQCYELGFTYTLVCRTIFQ